MSAIAVRESRPATAERTRGNALDGTGSLVRLILRRERLRIPACCWDSCDAAGLAERVEQLTSTEEKRLDVFRSWLGERAILVPLRPLWYYRVRYVVGVYGLSSSCCSVDGSSWLPATPGGRADGHAELCAQRGRAHLTSRRVVVAFVTNVALALALARQWSPTGEAETACCSGERRRVGLCFPGSRSRRAVDRILAHRPPAWRARARRFVGGAGRGRHDQRLRQPIVMVLAAGVSNRRDRLSMPVVAAAPLVGLTVVTAGTGYSCRGRRDIGAGLLTRPGAVSAPWLGRRWRAFRLHPGSILWWTWAGVVRIVFGARARGSRSRGDVSSH